MDTLDQTAADLGWTPCDLFGAEQDDPLARLDWRGGLLWLLDDGDRIVALADQTAVIETIIGARITYRRQPADERSVVARQVV